MDKIIVTFDGEGMGDGGADGFGYGVGYGGLTAGNYLRNLFSSSYAFGDGEGFGYVDSFRRGVGHGYGDLINFPEVIMTGTGCGISGYGDTFGGGFDRHRNSNRIDTSDRAV